MIEKYLKKLLRKPSSCMKITTKKKKIEYRNKNIILKLCFCFFINKKYIKDTSTNRKKNINIPSFQMICIFSINESNIFFQKNLSIKIYQKLSVV